MNQRISITRGLWRAGLLLWAAAANSAAAASVLMISIDGMKPEYVLQADAHGLKIPFLRSMLRDGVHAAGVTGVWPTVTYPSHTTLLTGVSPSLHGILDNVQFDPRRTFDGAWYWYADEIKARTLWQAAHEAGLSTASVGWPVSVAAKGVDTLIPEYWRSGRAREDSSQPSHAPTDSWWTCKPGSDRSWPATIRDLPAMSSRRATRSISCARASRSS